MSTSDAQRSPVHGATEDSTAEPSGPARAPQPPAAPQQPHPGADPLATPDASDDDAIARRAAELKKHPDTAEGIPSNFETGAALAGIVPDADTDADADTTPQSALPAGPGSADASSGGGAAAGIPGGGTDLRTSAAFNTGNPADDRKRLFPGANPADAEPTAPKPPGSFNDDTRIGSDPDESTYGGPLNLDDPKNV
jgi:hypothetical protein